MLGRDLWTIGQIIDSVSEESKELNDTIVKVFELSCYYIGQHSEAIRLMACQTLYHSANKMIKNGLDHAVE